MIFPDFALLEESKAGVKNVVFDNQTTFHMMFNIFRALLTMVPFGGIGVCSLTCVHASQQVGTDTLHTIPLIHL
mgnify:CR=1 FL=1